MDDKNTKQKFDSYPSSGVQVINGPPEHSKEPHQIEQSSEKVQTKNPPYSQSYNTLQVERQLTNQGEVQQTKDILIDSSNASIQTNDNRNAHSKQLQNTKLEDRLKQFEKKYEVVQSQLQS